MEAKLSLCDLVHRLSTFNLGSSAHFLPGIFDVIVDVLKPLADLLGEVGAEPAAEGLERVREVVLHWQLAPDPRRDTPISFRINASKI